MVSEFLPEMISFPLSTVLFIFKCMLDMKMGVKLQMLFKCWLSTVRYFFFSNVTLGTEVEKKMGHRCLNLKINQNERWGWWAQPLFWHVLPLKTNQACVGELGGGVMSILLGWRLVQTARQWLGDFLQFLSSTTLWNLSTQGWLCPCLAYFQSVQARNVTMGRACRWEEDRAK